MAHSHGVRDGLVEFTREAFLGNDALPLLQFASEASGKPEGSATCVIGRPFKAAADFWTRVGLMEHASVAAFSRFSLQLMALGAPSDLLQKSHEAAADEIRHARDAFALAGHYAGRPVGPGVMPMGHLYKAATNPPTSSLSLTPLA